jgi:protein-L-isoaspartate(D-aspartate) O-methyltransferase
MVRISTRGLPQILALLLAAATPLHAADDPFKSARAEMVREIEGDVRRTSERIGKTALNPRVMEVMGRVPRHEFVPESQKSHAYENRPLPIGYGQTISQPYIVALMTDLLRVGSGAAVLEVGTGSGYQAAILAETVRSVYTIEIVEGLAETAAERLKRLGFDNVEVRSGDGYYGWKERAPFDGIVVTAAASHIPPPLIEQLKPGGRMVIPVGGPFFVQQLMLVEKGEKGEIQTRQILPVAFVPLTGGH